MPERDYTNDYEDWLRDQPREYQGDPEPPQVGSSPAATYDPWNGQPPPTTPARPGHYWQRLPNGSWVESRIGGDNPTTTTTTTPTEVWPPPTTHQGGGDPLAMGGEPAPFNWSTYTPSRLSFPDFASKIGRYQQPTLTEAENEPGYQFSRDQGRKTLESSAAGRGVLRTGGTLKDILAFGDQFGQQNYQAVDNRKFRNWGADVDNEFRTYGTNRDTAFGVHDRNARGDEFSFNQRREAEKLTFADQYSRWRDKLNSLTNIATAGAND